MIAVNHLDVRPYYLPFAPTTGLPGTSTSPLSFRKRMS